MRCITLSFTSLVGFTLTNSAGVRVLGGSGRDMACRNSIVAIMKQRMVFTFRKFYLSVNRLVETLGSLRVRGISVSGTTTAIIGGTN